MRSLPVLFFYLLGWAFSRYLTRRGIRLDQPRKFPHEEEKVVVCLDFYSERMAGT